MNKILICTGFHRSATSATANYLFNAGLNMGNNLMGGNFSNKGGHFEDMPAVNMHDNWLSNNETSWQFHDEVELIFKPQYEKSLNEYINLRDESSQQWGGKDPRICLFLPQWQNALGDRGRYLFVLRHWASSIESLLHRHSNQLATNANVNYDSTGFAFWKDPTLAARMWLAYCRRLLAFVKANPEYSLLATQRALFNGAPLIESINQKLLFNLDEKAVSPYKTEWLRDCASARILQLLPESLISELNQVWSSLLELTELKDVNEEPEWVDDSLVSSAKRDDWFSKNSSINPENFLNKLSKHSLSESSKEYVASDVLLTALNESKINDVAGLFDSELFKQNNIEEVAYQRVCDSCFEKFATEHPIQVALAFWLQRHGQWELAKRAWQWCISLTPVYPYMYYNLALCYEATHDYLLANHFVVVATEKNPNNAHFWLLSARIMRLQGNVEEALGAFNKAVQLEPDKPAFVLPFCDFLDQLGEPNKALKLVTDLMDKHPENVGVKNMLIRLEYKVNPEKAAKVYKENVHSKLAQFTMEERSTALKAYLANTGSHAAEADLLTRVLEHWQGLEIN